MATLQQRIVDLAQAIGSDMKALAAIISVLTVGGASVKTVTINAPYDSEFSYTTTVLDVSLHVGSVVLSSFGSTPVTAENDAEDLAELTLVVNPIEGALEITISALGVFGGPIPINYMIGI